MRANDEFAELVEQSLPLVQESAQKWRDGLAALLGLVTAGLFLKGPEQASDIAIPWRAGLTAGVGLGLATALLALWLALRAAAGVPGRATLRDFRRQASAGVGGTLPAALGAVRSLTWARRLAAAALVLLAGSSIAWWWAPKDDEAPKLTVVVNGRALCGTLQSEGAGHIVLKTEGKPPLVEVPTSSLDTLAITESCAKQP